MDFGKAFTFMFEDPDWVRKLGIGTVVGAVAILLSPVLIGLVPMIMILGYCLDVLRNVADGQTYPLPEWEDWSGFLTRGFKLLVAFFVWSLPIILISIPMIIGAALVGDQSSGANAVFGTLFIICSSCLMVLWGLFELLISPAIYIRLAVTDRLASAFEVSRLWELTRDNLGNVIIAILLLIVAGIIAGIVGTLGFILLIIGALVTFPAAMLWQYLVQAHLFGQIGRTTVTPLG
ncbi:MAG: DUF4013 domain-containing protein [Anaerolineae bacterium]|nr:DUF4013 domain-containing protein [Anaerolineae bacterium]